jgi:hypothetical protein
MRISRNGSIDALVALAAAGVGLVLGGCTVTSATASGGPDAGPSSTGDGDDAAPSLGSTDPSAEGGSDSASSPGAASSPLPFAASNIEWPGPDLSMVANGGFKGFGGFANMCLDVPGGKNFPGQTLESWTCNDGSNQRFYFTGASAYRAPGPWGAIITAGGFLCLDGGSQLGAPVTLQPCSGSPSQLWLVNWGGIKNYALDGWLDVHQNSSAEGARIYTELQNQSTLEQDWWPFGFPLRLRNDLPILQGGSGPESCLDDFGNKAQPGTSTTLDNWPCRLNDNGQIFTFTANNEIMVNGLCIDVLNGNPISGSVSLETCTGSAEQMWINYSRSGVPNQIVSVLGLFGTPSCLGIDGASTQNGAMVGISPCKNFGSNSDLPELFAQGWSPMIAHGNDP